MDVPGWDGEREAGHAPARALDTAGVRAAAGKDLQLIRNLVLLRYISEMAHQLWVADERGVHQFYGRAVAEPRDMLEVVWAWKIVCERDIDGDPDVRTQCVRRGRGASESDLFLRGGNCLDL